MHYWPAGGPSFGCNTDSGFRTSAPDDVTCPDCLTGLAAEVPVRVTAVEIVNGVEVPIGEPRETTISRSALDLLHGNDAELQRIADETGETIETVRDLHEAMQVCGAEGYDEARAERFERARDAAYDAPGAAEAQVPNVDAAIETALRVRVDADLTQAVRDAHPNLMIKTTELKGMIEVAFAAAGFEVEQ